jgi:hypothetical protein
LREEGTFEAIRGDFVGREETVGGRRGEKRRRPVELATHLLGATTDPYNWAAVAMDSVIANKGEIEEWLSFSLERQIDKSRRRVRDFILFPSLLSTFFLFFFIFSTFGATCYVTCRRVECDYMRSVRLICLMSTAELGLLIILFLIDSLS